MAYNIIFCPLSTALSMAWQPRIADNLNLKTANSQALHKLELPVIVVFFTSNYKYSFIPKLFYIRQFRMQRMGKVGKPNNLQNSVRHI